jgi:hypothetical protein
LDLVEISYDLNPEDVAGMNFARPQVHHFDGAELGYGVWAIGVLYAIPALESGDDDFHLLLLPGETSNATTRAKSLACDRSISARTLCTLV